MTVRTFVHIAVRRKKRRLAKMKGLRIDASPGVLVSNGAGYTFSFVASLAERPEFVAGSAVCNSSGDILAVVSSKIRCDRNDLNVSLGP